MQATENREMLKVLLHEAAQARDDDRYMSTQNALLIPGALTLIGGLAAVFYQTCAVGDKGCPASTQLAVSYWVYVFTPLVPIALVGYMAFISRVMVLRSYYLRILEIRIQELTGQKENSGLPFPSWGHMAMEVSPSAKSEPLTKFNFVLIIGISVLMLFGCVWIAVWRIPDVRLSIFTLAIDGCLMAIPIAITVSNITGGAKLWEQALGGMPARFKRTKEGFPKRGQSSSGGQPKERPLLSYLVLPRNQEELLKTLFIPVSFFVGWLMVPGIPRPKADMIWYYLSFLQEVANSENNPEKDALLDPALRAAYASFVARLALAFLFIGLVFPYKDYKWAWHLSFALSVFVVAWVYEGIRSKCNAIGGEKGPDDGLLRFWTTVLIVFVGFGYGLRATVGFWLVHPGVNNHTAWFSLLLLFLGGSLFGSTFVALTWALESTRAKPQEFATKKGHLVQFHKAVSRGAKSVNETVRVLTGRQSPFAPWSWPAILATLTLTWFALYILGSRFNARALSLHILGLHTNIPYATLITVAESCIAGFIVVIPNPAAIFAMTVNLSGMSMILFRWFITQGSIQERMAQSVLVALLSNLPLIVSCFFRTRCFQDLPDFTRKLCLALAAGWKTTYLWFAKIRSKGKHEVPPRAGAPSSH